MKDCDYFDFAWVMGDLTSYQIFTILHGVLTVLAGIGYFEVYRYGTVTSRPVTWSDLTRKHVKLFLGLSLYD